MTFPQPAMAIPTNFLPTLLRAMHFPRQLLPFGKQKRQFPPNFLPFPKQRRQFPFNFLPFLPGECTLHGRKCHIQRRKVFRRRKIANSEAANSKTSAEDAFFLSSFDFLLRELALKGRDLTSFVARGASWGWADLNRLPNFCRGNKNAAASDDATASGFT